MKYLRSRRAWKAWARKNHFVGCEYFEEPKRFPCYAYFIVADWHMQQEASVYLYSDDIAKMAINVGLNLHSAAIASE